MQSTLRDATRSGAKTRKGDLIVFQSLPPGVKELSYVRCPFFRKIWYITFEGELELDSLNRICDDRKYRLTNVDKFNGADFLDVDGAIQSLEGMKNIRNSPHSGESNSEEDKWVEKWLKGFSNLKKVSDGSKPDRKYCVYRGTKEIARLWWTKRTRELCLCTSRRRGLELAEAYRTCSQDARRKLT